MNTKAVSEILGVSVSTVQRWVKQIGIQAERNELGHFIFTDEDIEMLKDVQRQLQQGKQIQEIEVGTKKRSGTVKTIQSNHDLEKITSKLNEIESDLSNKADAVVSYQLLQHRREIEELQGQIATLLDKVSTLEDMLQKNIEVAASLENNLKKSSRKKNKLTQLFSWL